MKWEKVGRRTRERVVISVLFVTVLALYMLKLFLSSDIGVSGPEYQKIEDQIKQIDSENESIKEKIEQAESLTNISQEAVKQGFTEDMDQHEYILRTVK